ncbi:MAG: energy transducer TonB [Gammaproteobacteria bacterium]|nr:energy transducer TonB [Gammaproteobacteria bacterium]
MTVTISAEGLITRVEVPPGAAPWMATVAKCVTSKMAFEPGKRDGRPVEAHGTLPIRLFFKDVNGQPLKITRPVVTSSADEIIEIYRRCYPTGLDVQSRVVFQVTITKEGSVQAPELLESSGNHQIDEAGLCILRELRFRPAKRGATPTSSTLTWPILVRPPPSA